MVVLFTFSTESTTLRTPKYSLPSFAMINISLSFDAFMTLPLSSFASVTKQISLCSKQRTIQTI